MLLWNLFLENNCFLFIEVTHMPFSIATALVKITSKNPRLPFSRASKGSCKQGGIFREGGKQRNLRWRKFLKEERKKAPETL